METSVSLKMTSRSEMKNDRGQALSPGLPAKQGLYDPQNEHDACGVGFVVNVKGRKSHAIVRDALTILINLRHRGADGYRYSTGALQFLYYRHKQIFQPFRKMFRAIRERHTTNHAKFHV